MGALGPPSLRAAASQQPSFDIELRSRDLVGSLISAPTAQNRSRAAHFALSQSHMRLIALSGCRLPSCCHLGNRSVHSSTPKAWAL